MTALRPRDVWLQRRAELSHIWLGNRFIQALDGLLEHWKSGLGSPRFSRAFFADVFPSWSEHKAAARTLIGTVEDTVSPRVLFDEPPLAACDRATREWLAPVIHALWRTRLGLEGVKADVEASLVAADEAHAAVAAQVRAPGGSMRGGDGRSARDELVVFRDRLAALSAALSRLPRSVEVV